MPKLNFMSHTFTSLKLNVNGLPRQHLISGLVRFLQTGFASALDPRMSSFLFHKLVQGPLRLMCGNTLL